MPQVRCEAGRRCLAQYGVDADELWFKATVSRVHHTDLGQWVDVEYDDGDIETNKPIKRVTPLESSSDSESDEEEAKQIGCLTTATCPARASFIECTPRT